MESDELKLAYSICREAHRGQKDKGGNDYYLHPLAVSSMVETEEGKIVALLHDVVEDSDITIEDLISRGFAPEIIDAVRLLTKEKNQEYMDYIESIKSNTLAREVKIADMRHNARLWRLDEIHRSDRERAIEYRQMIQYLEQ